MTLKTLVAASIIALAPGFALAAGCSYTKSSDTAMSCAAGFVLDAETGKCVAQTTS
jgi:hypothetical protein